MLYNENLREEEQHLIQQIAEQTESGKIDWELTEYNPLSLYYRVVVIRAPLQGLCYNVRDAVDWFSRPTARRFQKGSNHSPLQYC